MSTPRFFVESDCAVGYDVELGADDAHHVISVLRLHAGEPIVIVRDGTAWDATLHERSRGRARARIDAQREEAGGELPVAVTVVQAIVKGGKFDEVVEKCVELGVRRIVPALCERSYAQANPAKLERWRRIACSAAQQARRRYLPEVAEPLPWSDALASYRGDVKPLVAYENAPPGSLAAALETIGDARSVAIAVGPEGGLAPLEVDAARAGGCALVSLGPTILRTETAAPAMLAALAALRAWW